MALLSLLRSAALLVALSSAVHERALPRGWAGAAMSGLGTLPRWVCSSCPDSTYSERRPEGWTWLRGKLVCHGCRLDRLERANANYKPPPVNWTAPDPKRQPPKARPVERICQECGVKFEGHPAAQYHSKKCRGRAQRRRQKEAQS